MRELILHKAAVDTIGIYCAKVNGVERTEREDGWNDCKMAILERHCIIEDWFETLPEGTKDIILKLLKDETIELAIRDDKVALTVWVNDTFFYATGDCEKIEENEIEKFATMSQTVWGDVIWVALKRDMLPIQPIVDKIKKTELWDKELEKLYE